MGKRIKIIMVFIVAAAALMSAHIYTSFFTPISKEKKTRTIEIEKGASFRMIATELERQGIIRSAESFSLAARILNAYKAVKAGEYEFSTDLSQMEVLQMLVKGRVKKHMITVPEGYNIRDIGALLEREGLVKKADFIERAYDKGIAASLGVQGPTLEGYLFPDTYSFTKGLTPDEIIEKMTGRFKEVFFRDFEGQAHDKGLSMKWVITLASIIEKETGAPEERGLISAVFHNRLKKGIRLQSDPTVIYDIEAFDGNLKKRHLTAKTPYNTYVKYGLPPGPIASPGRDSIRAAIMPAEGDYIYFVSKNDGTHYFSKTLKEHNIAVQRYQKQTRTTLKGPQARLWKNPSRKAA